MSMKHCDHLEVWSQQILLPDASVYSRQWLLVRNATTPIDLLDLYLGHIRRCTAMVIRPILTEDRQIQFRLLGTAHSLLSFAPPEVQQDDVSYKVTLSLCGGFLVQAGECNRGRFSLANQITKDGLTISIELSDYCPLLLGSSRPSKLRKVLYRLTQAYIHKVVTISFLASINEKLTGQKLPVTVRKQPSPDSEEI